MKDDAPIENCMIQCALNQFGLNVLVYRATSAPNGRSPKNPITHKTACATMNFSKGRSGMTISRAMEGARQ